MITYEQIKSWWQEKENKNKVVLGVSFILVFFVGFGTGSFEREFRRDNNKPQTNYTTNSPKKPAPVAANTKADGGAGIVAGTTTAASASCVIKGNISTGGKK